MAALATVEDIEVRLGRTLSAEEADQVEALLDDVSAAVRAYIGQSVDTDEQTARLRVRNGTIRLPRIPVTEVESVADMDGNDIDFTWHAGQVVTLGASFTDGWSIEPTRAGNTWVDVTYTAGWGTVPADLVAVVCQIVGRAFGRPADSTGLTSESIAGYSYSVGGAAAAGPLGMLADEKAVLDRYRIPGGTAYLASA